jgi:hypothetical protein
MTGGQVTISELDHISMPIENRSHINKRFNYLSFNKLSSVSFLFLATDN